MTRRRVTRASIDHVALVTEGAYAATAVWPVLDSIYDLPPHIRALDEEWRTGRLLADIEARERRTASAAHRPSARIEPKPYEPWSPRLDHSRRPGDTRSCSGGRLRNVDRGGSAMRIHQLRPQPTFALGQRGRSRHPALLSAGAGATADASKRS